MVSPWLVWVAGALVVLGGIAGWFLFRRRRQKGGHTYVANSAYIFSLPSFARRLTLARIAAMTLVTIVAVSAVVTALLAGRPVDRYLQDERMATRDIVLCLDVSGSMMPFDSEVLRRFAEMIPSFHGERIGLNVWNATTRVVFPLTDDYAMVEFELEQAAELLDMDIFSASTSSSSFRDLEEWLAGTMVYNSMNASLIGDGLANCALAFDLSDDERSRTIIMATDNQVAGQEVFTLPAAAEFAAERDITVHAIYAAEFGLASERDEYESVITGHGGLFYELADPDAADGIIDEITAQQAVELDANPKVVEIDRPDRYYSWLVGFVAVLIVAAWRLRA